MVLPHPGEQQELAGHKATHLQGSRQTPTTFLSPGMKSGLNRDPTAGLLSRGG